LLELSFRIAPICTATRSRGLSSVVHADVLIRTTADIKRKDFALHRCIVELSNNGRLVNHYQGSLQVAERPGIRPQFHRRSCAVLGI
jgi:hypothetical protein